MAAGDNEKSSVDSTDSSVLVPQPHGGAIRRGGKPGNKGGGRPPDAFKRHARNLLKKRNLLPRLADIAEAKIGEIKEIVTGDGTLKVYTETPLREQRGAIDSLIKLGIGDERVVAVADVHARLGKTLEIIRDFLPHDQANDLIQRVRGAWR